jgi:hypothetical protein
MQCAGCGVEFTPSRANQRYHKKGCGRTQKGRVSSQVPAESNLARTERRKRHTLNFVGCDGEGVTRPDGTHDYVLFSVGDDSLYHEDGSALHWSEIFRFIYDHFHRHPDSAYVGFYLGYDFTQWLKTLPYERATRLLTIEGQASRVRRGSRNPAPWPVEARDLNGHKWELDILGSVRFRLRPKTVEPSPWLYICDTGGFWQCSFLTAIDPKAWPVPVATPEEHALIVEGKRKRATAEFDPAMIRYNVTENRVLSRLMTSLNEGFTAAGICLNRNQWFGPGQAASTWLDNIGAPTSVEVQEVVPRAAMDAARSSYYGGWFEVTAHGHLGTYTNEYDINSAYPAIIATLPCLLHGKWTHGRGSGFSDNPRSYVMVKATVIGSSRITGCMPHRTLSGLISRPSRTHGWYWFHEIQQSARAGLTDDVDVEEWWEYEPCDCPPPMAEIADLYQQRLSFGKNTPQGKALKLVYNSAYGKFAQSVGSPKYGNGIYASLITAGCRTAILRAIATHPTGASSLVMVATDGVYFQEEHDSLSLSSTELGAWDRSLLRGLTLTMPGIYWHDGTREKILAGQAPSLKSRGISARDLATQVAAMDDKWASFDGENWPSLTIPVQFAMVSAKQAAVRGAWDTAGVVTTDGFRELHSMPGHKRRAETVKKDYHSDWRTLPWPESFDGIATTPYDKTFGAITVAEAKEGLSIVEDAPTEQDLFSWALHRD